MSTGSILASDLILSILAAAAWLGSGVTAAARRRPLTLSLTAFALLVTLARAVTITALARAGWWFAAEKILIATPLSAAAITIAMPHLIRPPADLRAAAARLLFAGYATSAALLVTVLHGYPASPGAALLSVAGVLAATTLTTRILGTHPSPTMSRTTTGAAVVALIAGVAVLTSPGPASGMPHQHAFADPTPVGEPTRRITLTAATTTVKVSGRDVPAWAFNGQVPGPALEATVGDIVEVTLHNRDINQGVTLHWHGYDVPNSQDGVPGITQDPVLPGQEFVYRFRADQEGTYWYHTHSVSDLGVRMGLYGTLVIRPAPVTGIDVTLPVHTLTGHLLPEPRTDIVSPGTPMRLRLVNTDNTTHRYTLTGTPFLVTAIDGRNLTGPTPLTGVALSIPAGGRYDLVFTAPDTPIALQVDGRAVYSTGSTAMNTSKWPVFDPLAYGIRSPCHGCDTTRNSHSSSTAASICTACSRVTPTPSTAQPTPTSRRRLSTSEISSNSPS